MTAFSNQKIADLMADIQALSPERHQMALQVRDYFLKFAPDLVEEIKYGGLVFFREKELVGGIFFYKKHVSIEFSYGATLSDPHSVLEGKGKFRRHIKLMSTHDIAAKNIEHYIEETLSVK